MGSIVILDDHKLFLEGIKEVLAQRDTLEVLGGFNKVTDCANFLKKEEVELLLLDIQLKEESGITICRQFKQQFPFLKIIMVTMFQEEGLVKLALEHGADGYLLKNSGKEELFSAIQTVLNGGTYIDKGIQNKREVGSSIKHFSPYQAPNLSKREKEVLALILQELTTTEIAEKLFLSIKTVESHRANLFAKFDVRNVVGLVRKTLEHGINLSLD